MPIPLPQEASELVKRFERNRESYRSSEYNEAQVRLELINPFFNALGWDMYNEAGYAEAYKDVVHEDAIKIGGVTKAPDYAFRIGGVRKFFVEAKRPGVDIKSDPDPAYQLRRYAWSAKLPLSILTDFEEFAVYDCRIRPNRADKASMARTKYFTYKEYAERWDEIAAIFSREAILKGSFDKYVESSKKKRGTAEVDDAFLKEIETWRDLFARNIALRNPDLSTRELNYAVQRTVDRIIFLRICEDRGIEDYGQLMALQSGTRAYERLCQIFRRADERYNSGLFHFSAEKERPDPPDDLTLDLTIDDKVLKEVFKGLYYPESPFEFSVLPADILGHIYEQFLGKVIRLTPGHHAKVEDKPEVKKAGGVYYTPTYIVDYIVKNTVGNLLEGNTPTKVAKIRVLDPACGSGSFLLGAYQCLLDWHQEWYAKHDPQKHAKGRSPKVYLGPGSEWRLTTAEKKRILLNNIYGVDIDTQAVEVTKLSLLLKVLEGENAETLGKSLRLFHERALPDLGENIKCGNSLIGPDFYEGQQLSLLDDEERYRINAFDWEAEFPEIMASGGFDVVIGNPPYVRQEALSDLKKYFKRSYEAFHGVADLYAYFMERSVRQLRDGGRFSFIVSSSFLRTTYGEPLRRALKKRTAVLSIVDFGGLPVFANAKDTYVCIPLLAKVEQPERVDVSKVLSLQTQDLDEYVALNSFAIPHRRLSAEVWSLRSDDEAAVFAKIMEAGTPLGEYVQRSFFRGVTTGLNKAFIIDTQTRQKLIARDARSAELIKPVLGGQDVRRYLFNQTGLWLIFTRRGVDIESYPAIRAHLAQWKEDLAPKRDRRAKRGRKPGRYQWYEIQDNVAYWKVFDRPKLIFPDITKQPRFCLDIGGHYLTNTAYCLGTDDLYLLGVLNSRLFWFAISNISIPFGVRAGKYRYRLIYQYMEKVPIRVIDTAHSKDRARHSRIMELVERMLELQTQLVAVKTGHDRELIRRQIDTTDKQIDQLTYELYGLTDKEIRIVEEATR
jgi:methylase of polypeptide subunit release factors